MDAKRISCATGLACALLLTGCEWFTANPSARPENKPDEQPADPPIVVDAPPAAIEPPAVAVDDENIDTQVAQYIARVDDMGTRVRADRGAQPAGRSDSQTPPAKSEKREADIGPADARAPDANAADAAKLAAADRPVEEESGAAAAPRAPRLTGVAVRAADASDSPIAARPRAEPAPAVNTPISSSTAPPANLRAILDALPPVAENPSFRQQLDQRIAQVLAGEYEAAHEPLALVSNEQQTLASRFIEALIAVREGHLGDPAAANSAALQAIEQLGDELRRGSDLRLPTVAICSAVSGFGQYQPIEPAVFPAGVESEFVVYLEVRDFVSEKQDDGMFQTRFDLRTSILNRAGDTAIEYVDSEVVDRCRNRRSDCFIPRLVRLPATLSPGEYVVKVSVADKLGKKVAENRATIRVAAGH